MIARALLCPSCGGGLDAESRACPHCGTTAATRRCGVCFDLNLRDDRNCRRCGNPLPEEDGAAGAATGGCPGCGLSMTRRRLAGFSFDECDHCGGLWLSPNTAEAVTTRAEIRSQMLPFDPAPPPGQAAREEPARITYRKCPDCRKAMNRSGFASGSGLVLDVCKPHGVYFDRGELTRLFCFIERGGLEKARRREAESLREEIRDARRKAISMGGGDATIGPIDQSPAGGTALDLVRWIADLITAGRDR